jgi:hypothetical protein
VKEKGGVKIKKSAALESESQGHNRKNTVRPFGLKKQNIEPGQG